MGERTGAIALIALAVAAAAPSPALASVITGAGSLAGASAINLPASNYTGAGPVAIGGGVTWNSNQANSLFGWTGGYTTGNATIAPGTPIIELNDAYDVGTGGYASMWLNFATPTSGFLADLFWTDNENTNANSAGMYIYDSSMQLLEYIALNSNGNGTNTTSGYYGFSRPTADISYVYFDNSHLGARDLSYVGPTIDVGSVPEPATWAMMLLGFGVIGLALRRSKRSEARLQRS
ncbi:MAG: PEPxxWA-CTERM sorting domain-containing protein [Sphingomicrobium sp.]